MEKKDVEINAETINMSGETTGLNDDFQKKRAEFELELQALTKKYNFIIYAANTLMDNGEVVPMLKVVSNVEAPKEDDKNEEVTTVA